MSETEYPCRKLPREEQCDYKGKGGFMGHTCQRVSDKDHRLQITEQKIREAVRLVRNDTFRRLGQKGFGTWLSRHEILGFLTEEYLEAVEAVHSKSISEVEAELLDIAVGCIFGIACIESKTLDW